MCAWILPYYIILHNLIHWSADGWANSVMSCKVCRDLPAFPNMLWTDMKSASKILKAGQPTGGSARFHLSSSAACGDGQLSSVMISSYPELQAILVLKSGFQGQMAHTGPDCADAPNQPVSGFLVVLVGGWNRGSVLRCAGSLLLNFGGQISPA